MRKAPHYRPAACGLVACCAAGIPFFHISLLGDAVYTAVLFGGLAMVEKWAPAISGSTRPESGAPERSRKSQHGQREKDYAGRTLCSATGHLFFLLK
jgi:hypothetical protein